MRSHRIFKIDVVKFWVTVTWMLAIIGLALARGYMGYIWVWKGFISISRISGVLQRRGAYLIVLRGFRPLVENTDSDSDEDTSLKSELLGRHGSCHAGPQG